MARLYVFAICEKVIMDSATGAPSLIGLFDKITARTNADAPDIPANAVFPKEYAVFTSWDVEPSDRGKVYNQAYEFFIQTALNLASATL